MYADQIRGRLEREREQEKEKERKREREARRETIRESLERDDFLGAKTLRIIALPPRSRLPSFYSLSLSLSFSRCVAVSR